MTTYIDILPEEICASIYHTYLLQLVNSNEFETQRRAFLIRYLQKQLSQKQLRQLGL